MLRYEREQWASGIRRLGGVDEAGRGPWAGPVAAACVVFDPAVAEREENGRLSGLTDSKKLSPKRREFFFELLIRLEGVESGVAMVEPGEIDEMNILRATHCAMARAVSALPAPPEFLLVDGLPVRGLPAASCAIVRGDARSLSIAAASVLAKVTRDRRMAELDRLYPGYGFAEHKGYGTAAHRAALDRLGPCPIHRRSFRPVAERCR